MILRIFSLTLEPANPLQFSLPELRSVLTKQLAEFMAAVPAQSPAEQIIHRYPAVQTKQVQNELMVLGVCQGARFLRKMSEKKDTILEGDNQYVIIARDPAIRNEEFGIDNREHEYEFLTPWLALNQQYAKKFYDLSGKPARDAFMQKLLTIHLTTLARSLDYPLKEPVTCTAHVHFKRERIDRENVIVFLGKFSTNLRIPDYLGTGQSVSLGFGTIRKITPTTEPPREGTPE